MVILLGNLGLQLAWVFPCVNPASSFPLSMVVFLIYGRPVATINGIVYRLGIFNDRRMPQVRYPSMGVVAMFLDVHPNKYDIATNMVFFSLHV
jgi:hypothetical protein